MKEQSSTKQDSNLVEMRLQTIINLLLRDNFMCSSKRMIMLGWRKIKTTKVLLLGKAKTPNTEELQESKWKQQVLDKGFKLIHKQDNFATTSKKN